MCYLIFKQKFSVADALGSTHKNERNLVLKFQKLFKLNDEDIIKYRYNPMR